MAILRQLRMAFGHELIYHPLFSPICGFAKVAHDIFPVCPFDEVVVFNMVSDPLGRFGWGCLDDGWWLSWRTDKPASRNSISLSCSPDPLLLWKGHGANLE
jgi:hypothetical protein